MIKFKQSIGRAVVLSVGLLLFFSAPLASPRSMTPDLTNSVWKWMDADLSFALTFTQGKHETRELVAVLNGWGNDPLELRGHYSEDTPEPQLYMTGTYEGDAIVFALKFNLGDHEQYPFLSGAFSVGSKVFSVSTEGNQQCSNINTKKSDVSETAYDPSQGIELVGEWEDTSEALGFNEYWSITSLNGRWQVSGQFIRGGDVVGSFYSGEIVFDPKSKILSFQQIFDQKPDEAWQATNEIEATVQGDTLKFKVMGVEATLKRSAGNKK